MVHFDRPFQGQANLPVVGIIYLGRVPKASPYTFTPGL